ncbi:DNA cytosine methyltransferase [Paracoccus sp. (in: a-proteobacteria)]|uniref:DNA cytosine methyltransferase n=1 Tax=Paracoccus sp. TaxID=267 RepID=UPI002AFF7049|nr:DNA cytosine methyltransferase [Paracoccus sp. (in: a-proteobacteria)]
MIGELVIDSFAGGGGASTGIRMALGRDADIAINHDPMALAMHRINHPATRHLLQDVATVDSVAMCAGLPIGMLWMSPDCTDHSKAKGAAPRRDGDKTTRGIGWAIVGWVKRLPAWQRPRVVFLENVEEYVDWGPMLADGKRCPRRKGETFEQFVAAWRALGYGNIEWRQRRAWWSGAGTIRRRLYMVMRRDGEPIVWPERTFGNPQDAEDAARIEAGELRPWVTAADNVDFGLPCPSIFETKEQILEKLGLRAVRPLADKTMARIARGVKRHVLETARPVLVVVNHGGDAARDRALDQPLHTLTARRGDALVSPVIAYAQQGGGVRDAAQPVQTITASRKDQNQLIAPYLVPRYGERAGQAPRSLTCDRPGPTEVPTGNGGSLCAVHMMTMRPSQDPWSSAERPLRTIVADGAAITTVSAGLMPMISRQFGASVGAGVDSPVGTITAGGAGKAALVSAFVAQHNGGPRPGAPGHDVREPVSTITTSGSQQNLVAAHMLSLRGSDRRDSRADEPARTTTASGTHDALVSLPMLHVYYGSETDGSTLAQPLRTDTTRDRFGLVSALGTLPPFGPEHEARAREVADFLRAHGCWDEREFVTVETEGQTFVLVDIGMRMLTPRERFSAMGFPADYIIDRGLDEAGNVVTFSQAQQGHMCGNAVCPTEAAALVAANYQPREVMLPRHLRARQADFGLFAEAAE